METFIQRITEKILDGSNIIFDEAIKLYKESELFSLLSASYKIRLFFKSDEVKLCSIINAKSGNCFEDCIFCAQSSHHNTKIDTFPLRSAEDILTAAEAAKDRGAQEFSIVASGRGIEDKDEMEEIFRAITDITSKLNMISCVSLGILSKDDFLKLKKAGLIFYHHNLETSRNFFPKICTTHTFDDKVINIKNAISAGLKICSGAIFGLGEDFQDRIELAFDLRDLDVDSVPLNFLHPIKGTPAEGFRPLSPLEILRIIAIYRFILPTKDIRICGGREHNLRSLQPLLFIAGANGILIGDYLTTKGQVPQLDLEMIRDLELKVK